MTLKTTSQSNAPDDKRAAISERLRGYRNILEEGWSTNSIHQDYVDGYRPREPYGQCGVSSAWLVDRLASQLNTASRYCYGSLSFKDSESGIPSHCWVEIEIDDNTYVIDLTADQAPGFEKQIVFAADAELRAQGTYYRAEWRKSLDDLPADPVWERVQELRKTIGREQ